MITIKYLAGLMEFCPPSSMIEPQNFFLMYTALSWASSNILQHQDTHHVTERFNRTFKAILTKVVTNKRCNGMDCLDLCYLPIGLWFILLQEKTNFSYCMEGTQNCQLLWTFILLSQRHQLSSQNMVLYFSKSWKWFEDLLGKYLASTVLK